MKRKIVVCMLMLWVLACIPMGGWAAENDTGTPQLVVPEAVFEFKATLEDESVIHKFVVQNKGTAELAIIKVKSG